jgi:hypothetical protein
MFRIFRKHPEERFIGDGHVQCPVRGGDVEADICGGCQWLEEIDDHSRPAFVRCRPPARQTALHHRQY